MSRFASQLLTWYSRNKRTLPWRDDPDPYRVWISEIMLQQTRVETVIPYFMRWIARFPSIRELALASQQDVLSQWEGLGYYSRARNLHQAAQIVLEQYDGGLPRDVRLLRSLPGVGRYTAGAIASIAFGLDEPLLDANVRRVLARVFAVRAPADSPRGQETLWGLAGEHLPKGRSSEYNQALMDLGAMVCVPKNPRCTMCPLARLCLARELGLQEKLPILKARRPGPHYTVAAAVIKKRGRVLLVKRSAKGLLGGMWEFPNVRVVGDPKRCLASAVRSAYSIRVRGKATLGIIKHAYTHFSVTVHVITSDLISIVKDKRFHWAPLAALDEYPMGKVDRQIARALNQQMEDFSPKRHRMVEEQIAQRGLRDQNLLSAFEEVPRHLFVPENVWYAAYNDAPLPIGFGQTISQPYIVALMTSLLQLTGDERILEVGTGSGYQAAILSRLAAEVHTVEFLPDLAIRAETLLRELEYSNVHVHIGDGSLGWLEAAPYPAIIVTASSPKVPDPLLEQLAERGRLVLPVESHRVQLLKVLTRRGYGFVEEVITSVAFVPLRGKYGWK